MEFKGSNGIWISTHNILSSSIYCRDKQIAITMGSTEEKIANITLMSKSQEMLEMLKILIQDIEEEGNYSRQTGYDLEEAKKLIKSATEI